MTEYYKDKLEQGMKFQDFVSDKLRQKYGIYVGVYSSREYQQDIGESASGIEIKFDDLYQRTNNIYIEVSEKSNASMLEYTPSGVMRDDNTWLYLIGNYTEAFMFSKHQLRMILMNSEYIRNNGIVQKKTPTSIGYLLPSKWIKTAGYCLKHFVFDDKPAK